ncbi:MAG: hypothetical protein IKT43_00975, partial [Clostridia bacterium]|nr:hypothetical protein [Clostridia bacterium]
RMQLIHEGGISAFHKTAIALCHRWFDGVYTEDPFLDLAEYFVMHGGTYGSVVNHLALHMEKYGGRFGYFLHRVFPSYKQMVSIYPFLKKCPPLLPFLWIVRWFSHLFRGGAKRSLREMARNQTITPDKRAAFDTMMKALDLKAEDAPAEEKN